MYLSVLSLLLSVFTKISVSHPFPHQLLASLAVKSLLWGPQSDLTAPDQPLPCLTAGETKAQKGTLTCPGSHSCTRALGGGRMEPCDSCFAPGFLSGAVAGIISEKAGRGPKTPGPLPTADTEVTAMVSLSVKRGEDKILTSVCLEHDGVG